MASPIVEIFELIEYVNGDSRPFQEGSKILNSNHILLCGLCGDNEISDKYFGLCLRSSSLSSYPHEINIEISFKNNKKTIGAHCSCEAGNSGKCKHIVGMLLFLNRYDAVMQIYEEMHQVYRDSEIDWMQIHDAGCTIDDTELPHHITNKADLDRLIEGTFKRFLNALPAPPTIVTIARSCKDEYCPEEDVEQIQAGVLDELRQRIGSEIDVRLAYLEQEEEVH